MIVTKKNPNDIQVIRTPKRAWILKVVWIPNQYVNMRSFLGDQGVVKVPLAPLNGPSHSHTDTVGLRVPRIRVPRGLFKHLPQSSSQLEEGKKVNLCNHFWVD